MNYFNITLNNYINYGILPLLITMINFWVLTVIFITLDHYCESNNILNNWKYHRKYLNSRINWNKYIKSINLVILNQVIVNLPVSLLCVPFNMDLNKNALPYYCLPLQIIGIYFIEDVLFYSFHRLIHCKLLYKYIHSIHHEWNVPVVISTIYCHPIEHLCGNILPIMITGHLFRLDWVSYNIWLNIASINALIVHSDYNIYNFGKSHNEHHKYRTCHYGTGCIMDYLFGTDKLIKTD